MNKNQSLSLFGVEPSHFELMSKKEELDEKIGLAKNMCQIYISRKQPEQVQSIQTEITSLVLEKARIMNMDNKQIKNKQIKYESAEEEPPEYDEDEEQIKNDEAEEELILLQTEYLGGTAFSFIRNNIGDEALVGFLKGLHLYKTIEMQNWVENKRMQKQIEEINIIRELSVKIETQLAEDSKKS